MNHQLRLQEAKPHHSHPISDMMPVPNSYNVR